MKKKANQQKLIKKKNNNGHEFLLKIINPRSRNLSSLEYPFLQRKTKNILFIHYIFLPSNSPKPINFL